MKKLTVSGQVIDLRSDHLLAVINYAIEQAATSEIEVLSFGANENDLQGEEQLEYLLFMQHELKRLTKDGNQDLLVVKCDEDELWKYYDEQ